MGIPGFASRIRDFGTRPFIGQTAGTQSQSQKDRQPTLAIIDGPALAHFFYETSQSGVHANTAIGPQYNYTVLGEAAVSWLETLRSYGFEIEGVYFDGALPAAKRQTRMERMQKHVDNLHKFKQLDDGTDKQTGKGLDKFIWRAKHAKQLWPPLQNAKKDLAAPPFLYSAVIEALLASEFADITWVVDGEADAFCAAAAYEAAQKDHEIGISIFTNDSDLVIWDSGYQTCIVMINEMTECVTEDGTFLQALRFWPMLMATRRQGPNRLPDLIQPAFLMLDQNVTFQEALNAFDPELNTEEYLSFASMYWITLPRAKLIAAKSQREQGQDIFPTDPRISELIRHTWSEKVRKQDMKARSEQLGKTGTTIRAPELQAQTDAAQKVQNPYSGSQQVVKRAAKTTLASGEAESFTSEDLTSPVRLDMFLPMLFEDPNKTAAWRIGMPFRNAAEGIAMLCFDDDNTRTYEYRKTGQGIAAREVRAESDDTTKSQWEAWSDYVKKALQLTKHLKSATRWRFMVMELTLADFSMDGKPMPPVTNIVEVVNRKPLVTWNLVQLSARYQAEYFSLMMLKQVLGWVCKELGISGGSSGFQKFAELVKGLPGVAEFFDKDDISQEEWMALEGRFRAMFSVE